MKYKYKLNLAKADKGFKFQVHLGHPLARGVAAGGRTGATAGAGIGAALAAFVGAGIGAIIGCVSGATAGASITAELQKCRSVFMLYGGRYKLGGTRKIHCLQSQV